jgi:tetratricopeptide (TPR) repeat protein
MIPTEGSWTVIFSKVSDAWGSFSYDPKEDALRVTVTPAAAPMEERLSYRMDDPGANSVTVSLYWDKLRVPFVVEADVKEIVFRDLRDRQLRGMPRFFWQGWNQAAAWCLNNNVHLDDALAWSDQSIGINPTFNNLNVKAGLLEKKGDMAGAQELREKALGMAGEQDINLYAYQLLGQGKNDEAIRYFEKNTKDYPQSWNTWDSLAEAYATVGRKDDAVTNYRKALDMTGSQDQKKRIEAAIAKLE